MQMNNLTENDWYAVSCFLFVGSRSHLMWLNESSHWAVAQMLEELNYPRNRDIAFYYILKKISEINIYRALVDAGLKVIEEIGIFKYSLFLSFCIYYIDTEGRTVFYIACMAGNTEILDYLVECGIPEHHLHKKSKYCS